MRMSKTPPKSTHNQQVQPLLGTTNSLVCLEPGVWVDADDQQRDFISYTDGDASENAVYAAIEKATDRSVDSYELDALWDDWAMEYHLGSKRSNIYRGLNLTGVKRVLEVGCGCGAITRFLGEQGFQVDAIEGTLRRAQIARLRTEDLLNVQLISSNYHQLELPENAYDLIVFTGVLEYSGAYAQDGLSPEQQLAQTLASAQQALAPEGVILVAIENRMGFKYVAGASEDHLNLPNIGLLNYPEPASRDLTRGIRTWSKRQWSAMLKGQQGITAHAFCYPFPDYKVPEVILSDHFLSHCEHPEEVMNGVRSRDYFNTWRPKLDEALFWKTAAETKSLDQFSNSFLIVLAKQESRLSSVIDFDFVRFPNLRRKREHRYLIQKLSAEAQVLRRPITESTQENSDGVVRSAKLTSEPYIDGEVLLQQWLNQLSVESSYAELAQMIQSYKAWLFSHVKQHSDPGILVDALPQNIIVDAHQVWHLIDQEWQTETPLGAEHIFFRAMLHFGLAAGELLTMLSLKQKQHLGLSDETVPLAMVDNLRQFIVWSFAVVELELSTKDYDAFVEWEQAMQTQLVRSSHCGDLHQVLDQALEAKSDHLRFADLRPVEVQVFWTQVDGIWHIDHSAAAPYSHANGNGASNANNRSLSAAISLPAMIATHPYIQINPAHFRLAHCHGWMAFDHLTIEEITEDGDRRTVCEIEDQATLLKIARLENMRVTDSGHLLFTTIDPKMVLHLPGLSWSDDCAGGLLTIYIKTPLVQEYVNNYQALIGEDNQLAERVSYRQDLLNIQGERIHAASEKLAQLEKQISEQAVAQKSSFWEKLKNRMV